MPYLPHKTCCADPVASAAAIPDEANCSWLHQSHHCAFEQTVSAVEVFHPTFTSLMQGELFGNIHKLDALKCGNNKFWSRAISLCSLLSQYLQNSDRNQWTNCIEVVMCDETSNVKWTLNVKDRQVSIERWLEMVSTAVSESLPMIKTVLST